MSRWYSLQQPKWMIENKIKKLQKFHNSPTSITATNTSAESARVLNTALLSAILRLLVLGKIVLWRCLDPEFLFVCFNLTPIRGCNFLKPHKEQIKHDDKKQFY